MHLCCPPGRGCNCPEADEPCILTLCRQVGEDPQAALAVERWDALQRAPGANRAEWRFRRRAYERARDGALVALLMRAERRAAAAAEGREQRKPATRRRTQLAAARHPRTPLDVLLRQHRGMTP